MKNYILTSESVTIGHPDKICDYIADSILDEALKQDPYSKMAVEATIKDDLIFLYGEYHSKAILNFEEIALQCMKEIGYEEDYHVITKISQQSQEINHAVEGDEIIKAGDQGIMFGYATNETKDYMPFPIYYAHLLAKQLAKVQREEPMLGIDGKTQVSVEYENNQIKRIDTIVISTQHKQGVLQSDIAQIIQDKVIQPIIPHQFIDEKTKYLINPSGSFVVGGSFGDSGTTGRKIVCDTYGGIGHIGGGCFSSKDPSKVDRTAAYYCRYVAKNIVAHGLADRCEIQVSYAIGKEEPVSLYIDTFHSAKYSDEDIMKIIQHNFSFKVDDMIKELDLLRPIYKDTAVYGHFGNTIYPWEQIKELDMEVR